MRYEVSERITDDARSIRKAVFMDEQGFSQEFDRTDETSLHIVAYDDETPAGVCHVFPNRGSTLPLDHQGISGLAPSYHRSMLDQRGDRFQYRAKSLTQAQAGPFDRPR